MDPHHRHVVVDGDELVVAGHARGDPTRIGCRQSFAHTSPATSTTGATGPPDASPADGETDVPSTSSASLGVVRTYDGSDIDPRRGGVRTEKRRSL